MLIFNSQSCSWDNSSDFMRSNELYRCFFTWNVRNYHNSKLWYFFVSLRLVQSFSLRKTSNQLNNRGNWIWNSSFHLCVSWAHILFIQRLQLEYWVFHHRTIHSVCGLIFLNNGTFISWQIVTMNANPVEFLRTQLFIFVWNRLRIDCICTCVKA